MTKNEISDHDDTFQLNSRLKDESMQLFIKLREI